MKAERGNESPTDRIESVEQLEDLISTPSDGVIDTFRRLDGDVIVLGVGGKMGPSLARMAKRASDAAGEPRRIIGVSRFSSGDQETRLQEAGVETIQCDLLDLDQVRQLPDAPNVVFMAGMKFGSTGHEALTWAINAYVPGGVCRKYHSSRIAVFSTGNLYGLTPVCLGGALETDELRPEGEYSMSALGRERIFEYFSSTQGTMCSIIRLNYAVEMRYGVLVDIARRVWCCDQIDLSMGNANLIWQGDANAMALQSLGYASSPPFFVNVAGPETLSVRRVAEQFGEIMKRKPFLCGEESTDALISNGQLAHRLFGYPRVSVQQMIRWIADWVMSGGENLGKPTHFETRDGKY